MSKTEFLLPSPPLLFHTPPFSTSPFLPVAWARSLGAVLPPLPLSLHSICWRAWCGFQSPRIHSLSSGVLHPPPGLFCRTCSELCPQHSSPEITDLLCLGLPEALCSLREQAHSPPGPLPAFSSLPTLTSSLTSHAGHTLSRKTSPKTSEQPQDPCSGAP